MPKAPITPITPDIEDELSKREQDQKDTDPNQSADISDKANREKERPHPPGGGNDAERQPS
jgi:hypothetical protein